LGRQPQNRKSIAMRNRIVASFQLSGQDCRGLYKLHGPPAKSFLGRIE
jgi:hypothetical protein